MAEKSRTEYSARNAAVAICSRILAILGGFVSRVVFAHTLSQEYGINGLFNDILNVLALSELGVGTAITFALYKPIAEGDIERQKSLMRMYRNFYRGIGLIVLALGMLLVPFLGYLFKEPPQVEHLTVIYLMYLANSVLSYTFVYKRTLIDAHQLNYISVYYQTVSWFVQSVLQIGVLLFTGNFILYVSVMIVCTVVHNLCISVKANKMYPYLRNRKVARLPEEERKEIFRNIRAMFMHKTSTVIVNSTDNLLLSALVGIQSVNCYTTYYLVIGSVRQILNQMFNGITASVGNLGVESDAGRVRKIFEASFFLDQWVFGMAVVCLYQVLNPFVELFFGSKFVFPASITLVLCLNFYLTGMRQATLVFRDSLGVFWYDRYKSLVEAVVNLVVSLILGSWMGTIGVFIGTTVSIVTTSLWVEPYMLYKHKLKCSVRKYFLCYAMYGVVTFAVLFFTDFVCSRITGNLFAVCALRLACCLLITNLVYLLLYHRTEEFRLLAGKALGILKKNKVKQMEISREEKLLLELLSEGLKTKSPTERKALAADRENLKMPDWERLGDVARRHSVLSLLCYPCLGTTGIPDMFREAVQQEARRIVLQSYKMLFTGRAMVRQLEQAGITVAVLKGVAAARSYPEPELRKAGDIDLLVEPGRLEEACKALEKVGCRVAERQPALHHVVLLTEDGIEIEIHTMLAEPFDNEQINSYLKRILPECLEHVVWREIMGVEFPVLNYGCHAYELLLHMLQHFLRSGFGLRFLCDWVVLWRENIPKSERKRYLELVQESKLKGFSDMVTLACCKYLGLERNCVDWMEIPPRMNPKEFMKEVLEAEEFGKSSGERMVMLRKPGLAGYVQEFHHQMHLNFPRAGRWIPFWPVLWIVTLLRFLRNNRKFRKISGRKILRKAAERSKVMEQIRLWK